MSVSEKPTTDASNGAKNSLAGTVIAGQWTLLQRLGRGGIGHVYEAQQIGGNRRVAIKLLRKAQDWDDESETIVDRFYHEAQILRRLQHPGIIDVYDFGFEEDLGFYLVMELLQGQSLLTYMQKNTGLMPWKLLYSVLSQVCDAMGYAHQRNIVHRDLKPEHIFLIGEPDEDVIVKVFDFGIARFEHDDENTERLTQQGVTLGTPRYLSPEQTMGANIDLRSDIYTLTIILFELITRRRVFQVEGAFQLMTHHAYIEAPTLSEARPDLDIPDKLEQLVIDGLAKKPDARPQDMVAFKERLRQALIDSLSSDKIPKISPTKSVQLTGSFYMVGGRRKPTPPEAPRPSSMDQQQSPEEIAAKLSLNLPFKEEALSTPPPQPAPNTPLTNETSNKANKELTNAHTPVLSVSSLQEEGDPLLDSRNDKLSREDFEALEELDNEEHDDGDGDTMMEEGLSLPPAPHVSPSLDSVINELEDDLKSTEVSFTLPSNVQKHLEAKTQEQQGLHANSQLIEDDHDNDPDTMLEPAPKLVPPMPQVSTPLPKATTSAAFTSANFSNENGFSFVGGSNPSLPSSPMTPPPNTRSSHAQLRTVPHTTKPPRAAHTSSPGVPSSALSSSPGAHNRPINTMKPVSPRHNGAQRQGNKPLRPKIRSAKYQEVLEQEKDGPSRLWIKVGVLVLLLAIIGVGIAFFLK